MNPLLRMLFLCTHNYYRSIIAAVLLRHLGNSRVVVASGGSEPIGTGDSQAIVTLLKRDPPINELCSKSWDLVADFHPDVFITIFDQAARESCPLWLVRTPKVHWGAPDTRCSESDHRAHQEAFAATVPKEAA